MTIVDLILLHVTPFALVLARIGGIFIFAPALGSPIIPAQVKALIVAGLTFVVYPSVAAPMPGTIDLIALIPMMLGETLIGLSIGLIVAIPVMSVQMGGLLIGQQMGLGLGTVYNPAIDADGDVVGQVLFYLALAIFMALGGMELLHAALLRTFDHVPLGAFAAGQAPLELLTGVVASGYALAIRVAAPVLCIIMLETISTGVLMKTVPQLNVLTFGFPIKIIAAATMLIASLPFIDQAVRGETIDVIDQVFLWIRGL